MYLLFIPVYFLPQELKELLIDSFLLACAFICRESNQNLSIISFILAWTFILLQLKEFRNMAFYINDSIFGSIFFFLTGLHFFHVVVGIILISIILGIVSIVSLPPASPNQATLHRLGDAGRRGSEPRTIETMPSLPWNSITCYPRRTYYNIMSIASNIGSPLRVNRCNWIPKPTEMPSYPYEPGCESRTDSLLTPGMDNTRHFYSITAVAGIVWTQTIPRSNSGTSISTNLPTNDYSTSSSM